MSTVIQRTEQPSHNGRTSYPQSSERSPDPEPDLEMFRAAFDHAPVGMTLVSPDGRYLKANPAFCAFSGYSEQELTQLTFQSLTYPDDLAAEVEQMDSLLAGPIPAISLAKRYVRKSGEVVWGMLRASLVRDPAGNPLYFVRQVVEIKKPAETAGALMGDEAKFRSLVSGNIIGILLADLDHIIEANDIFLEMIGYTHQELRERKINWREITPSEWLPWDERALEEMLARGACTPFEKEYICKDDHRVPILIGATVLVRSPLTWMCFVLDLTEQKRMQASERDARRQAERAVLDRDHLLSLVAHDLRNPLTAIKGTAQILARRAAMRVQVDNNSLADLAGQIEQSAARMNAIIEEILDVSKLQSGTPLALSNAPVDLVELVSKVVDECRRSGRPHEIVLTTAEPHLTAEWDPGRLERVFFNLLDNAVKYSPAGSVINIDIKREPAGRHDGGRAWAKVTVTDQGIGIPAADLPHIFDWYNRASNAGEWADGVGIGLAGALHIAEQYGGTITVESQEGVGSVFTVRLPLPSWA